MRRRYSFVDFYLYYKEIELEIVLRSFGREINRGRFRIWKEDTVTEI